MDLVLNELVGLVTGIGMRAGKPVLEMRLGSQKPQIMIPAEWNHVIEGERECIGYRAPSSGSLVACPDMAKGTSQCPACLERAKILPCIRCRGDRCRNPERQASCIQPENHAVYLVAYAPGVHKVGVARWERRQTRLWEQGARAGLIIGRTDGLLARRMETVIHRSGIPDRWSQYDHMQALAAPSDPAQLTQELKALRERLIPRLGPLPWLDEPESYHYDYPALPYRPEHYKIHSSAVLHGKTEYAAGRIVILRREGGEYAALYLADLVGYNVKLRQNEPLQYQAALPLE